MQNEGCGATARLQDTCQCYPRAKPFFRLMSLFQSSPDCPKAGCYRISETPWR